MVYGGGVPEKSFTKEVVWKTHVLPMAGAVVEKK